MNGVEKVYDYLLSSFFNEDGTLADEEYFIDSIMMIIQNTEYLYKWGKDSQRRSHTIAYEGLLELLKNEIGEPITSPQLKAAFKKLGVDFKEVLKPVVDEVDEWRKIENESKEIKEEVEKQLEIEYTSHTKKDDDYWEGTLSIAEVKRYFKQRDIKFKCEPGYSTGTYKFYFDPQYKDQLNSAWTNLVNMADVERNWKNESKEIKTEDIKYNVYVLAGGDGVYNSHLVDTVDSEEQAIDRVAEVGAEEGSNAYYVKVVNGKEVDESKKVTEGKLKKDDIISGFEDYLKELDEEANELNLSDYMTDIFYDLEDEDDMNEANEAEEELKKKYNLKGDISDYISDEDDYMIEDKKVKEFRIIDTSNNKVLKTFKADERDKGYKEMREMGKKLKDQGKEDTLIYKEFRVKSEAKDTDYIIVKQTTEGPLYMNGKSTSFDKKNAQIFNSEEEAREALHDYKENVVDPEANEFKIARLNEFKEQLEESKSLLEDISVGDKFNFNGIKGEIEIINIYYSEILHKTFVVYTIGGKRTERMEINEFVEIKNKKAIENEGLEIECNQEDLIESVDIAKIMDQINELESQLEMMENEKDIDQAEVKKVKDKITRLNKKLDEGKMLEAIDNEKDEINLKEIRTILERSGIKSERTLDLMSKDILKDLKNNYADDCNIDGIFPGVVIVDAFQKKVEQITGKKPQLKFGEEKEISESKFDKCQATLPLDAYHSIGIIVSDDGETVQYMYSNDEESVYESEIEYDEEGNPFFRDEDGNTWRIDEFMRTNYGESRDLSKDLYGAEADRRNSQRQKEYERDLQYVKDIMAGKTVIDDKYHEKLSLETAKKWLRDDYVYIHNLLSASPEDIDKKLARDLPEIFGETKSKRIYANKEIEKPEILNEDLTAAEVLKRDLPIYLKTNEGYMELSIDEAPEKPEDYDEGYIAGWNKGEDPAFDAEQELKYKEAMDAFNNGDVYQFRQVSDDIIYTICYGDKELDEMLRQLNATIVNIEDLMK